MKRKIHQNKIHRISNYHFLSMAALLLFVSGLWLTCYHAYHYSRNLYARADYSKSIPDSEQNEGSSAAILPANGAQSPALLTLKQALFSKEGNQFLYLIRPGQGERFGELSIPKLNLTVPIYEGTRDEELNLGVGHYEGSVLPGEKDNCVLSGHRNTVFQELGQIGRGDALLVTTAAGSFRYIVDKVRIVDKEDRTVIVPKPHATLTVSTCYPFIFAGSAPQRYVLVAHQVVNSLSTRSVIP